MMLPLVTPNVFSLSREDPRGVRDPRGVSTQTANMATRVLVGWREKLGA